MGSSESRFTYIDPRTGYSTTYCGNDEDVEKFRKEAEKKINTYSSEAVATANEQQCVIDEMAEMLADQRLQMREMRTEFIKAIQMLATHISSDPGKRPHRGRGYDSFSDSNLEEDDDDDDNDDDIRSSGGPNKHGSQKSNDWDITVKCFVDLYSKVMILYGSKKCALLKVSARDRRLFIRYSAIAEFALAANAKYRQTEIESYPLETALKMSQAFMADDNVRKRIAEMKASGELIDLDELAKSVVVHGRRKSESKSKRLALKSY